MFTSDISFDLRDSLWKSIKLDSHMNAIPCLFYVVQIIIADEELQKL